MQLGYGIPTFEVDPLLPVLLDIQLLLYRTFLSLLAFCAEFSSQFDLIEAGDKGSII